MKIETQARIVQQYRVSFRLIGEGVFSSRWFDTIEEAEQFKNTHRPCRAADDIKIVTRLHTIEAFPVADFLQRFAWA